MVGILVFAGSGFLIWAYPKNDIDKVYNYLAKKWTYYNLQGEKIKVSALSRKSMGTNHEVIVNGKAMNPADFYDENGRGIANPDRKNNAKAIIITGSEPGVLRGITDAHNKYRKKTGVPNLVWSPEIAAYAQKWAEYLKANNRCKMKHRSHAGKKEKPYGENLAWAGGKELGADEVVEMWYEEIKDYNYANNSCRAVCGHYTQVVWKTSRKVGCGMTRCGNEEVWVCNYDPPGNWVGQKPY